MNSAFLAVVQSFSESPHGRHVEPNGLIDWGLVAFSIGVVIVVTILTVWYFVRPGEDDPRHIKRSILRDTIGDGPATPP